MMQLFEVRLKDEWWTFVLVLATSKDEALNLALKKYQSSYVFKNRTLDDLDPRLLCEDANKNWYSEIYSE